MTVAPLFELTGLTPKNIVDAVVWGSYTTTISEPFAKWGHFELDTKGAKEAVGK